MFAPVAVPRASSAIAEQIRAAIVNGRLGAGDRLPAERELAEQFGVSRVTVRDALRGLEAKGLIDVRVGAHGGAFVTVPSGAVVGQTMSDMLMMQAITPEDIVEARLIVELGTVTIVCARATDDDLGRLRELSDRAREALKSKTYTQELSWDFHALLAEVAHNAAVEGLTESFRSSLSLHPLRTRAGAHAFERTVEDHERILAALERRNGVAARRELAAHLLREAGLEKRESDLLALWQAERPQSTGGRRAK
jgi:DNA-binding FadR family transcriptional regulator